MKKVFGVLLLLAIGSLAQAASFAGCQQFFHENLAPNILSPQPGKQRELCFDNMAILYSGESKTPLFVVERLDQASLQAARKQQRTDRFYEEARLPAAERASLDDYKSSGYDRGHMAPAADQPTPNAMAQSFSLANIVPQARENNRGIWAKDVEKPTRQYAMRATGYIYVMTGPVFYSKNQTIGAGRVWVPAYLYKLVYDPANNRAWAYWVKNTDDATMQKPISYQELVKRTGIDFLPKAKPLN